MTREERNTKLKHFITCLKCEVSGKKCDDNCSVQYEAGNMGEIIENLEAISKALEQEPLEVEATELQKAYHKGFEDCRKAVLDIVDSYSESQSNVEDVTQDIISYVVALPPVNPQPYEDAISREDALMCLTGEWTEITDEVIHRFIKRIKALPPVNPQSKTGHWIFDEILDKHYYCSECKSMGVDYWDFCPNCGAKMVEQQESEE